VNPVIKYDPNDVVRIWDVDHPEPISVGPGGEAYTTGTAGQVYRLDLDRRAKAAGSKRGPGTRRN
jgi:hypothetical protein